MSAIQAKNRCDADRDSVLSAHLRFGLVMAAAYSKRNPTIPTLRILDPMVSRPESMQLLEAMTFDPWWDLMESIDLLQLVVHPHPMEEPHLRVVGDLTNPRRFGVAWTEAGRRASREREEWNRRAF